MKCNLNTVLGEYLDVRKRNWRQAGAS